MRELKVALLAGIAAVGLSASAYAVPTANGQIGFIPLGGVTINSTGINGATTFTMPSTNIVNDVPTTYLGSASSFYSDGTVSEGNSVTFDDSTLTYGATPTGTLLTIDGYTFDATSATWARSTATDEVSVYFLGTFDGAPTYQTGDASLSLSFNQSGGSGDVNYSATLSTPPAPDPVSVPEPATMAVLGAGMIGLLATRRRA